jgi:hypothetical protein
MAIVRNLVVDPVLFVVRDIGASRTFYTAALAPLGFKVMYEDAATAWSTSTTAPERRGSLPVSARPRDGSLLHLVRHAGSCGRRRSGV